MLVIAVVIMASMVVVLRGKSPQQTVLDVSGLNSIDSSYYLATGDTIWQDPLTNASQWRLSYQTNSTQVKFAANRALEANVSFVSEPYAQSVRISRSVSLPLSQNPLIYITLEASLGARYGIRISGQDNSGAPFEAWSESSYLQHRRGLSQPENFTINPKVEAYKVNGGFPAATSQITSLLFYLEISAGQSGQFSLSVSRISAVSLNQIPFNLSNPLSTNMAGILLNVNTTNSLGYSDNQFFNGFVDYYLSGTPNLVYTVYYMHDLNVIGQGFDYPAGTTRAYNVAVFEINKINSYPPFLTSNNTDTIVLAPEQGSFQSFQFSGFTVRYLSQGLGSTPSPVDATSLVTYYLVFLFVTPVVMVILFARVFSREATNE